jgi:hypothetical protein
MAFENEENNSKSNANYQMPTDTERDLPLFSPLL